MVNNTNELKEGVLNGSIPSAFANSAVTSSVGTKKYQSRNAFVLTGPQQDKAFHMKNRAVEAETAMDKLKRCAHHTSNQMKLADQHTQVH
jgi:hypothetical protein